MSDIMGQVLDDFLEQSGVMPEDLTAVDAFERISRGQLAVTLAYQLGRLEGRSPQLVENLVARAVESHGFQPVDESAEITDGDLTRPQGAGLSPRASPGIRPAADIAGAAASRAATPAGQKPNSNCLNLDYQD